MNRPSGAIPPYRPTGALPAITAEQLEDLPFAPAPVQDMLRLLVKAVRAHQIYLPNNPVYHAAVDAARNAFKAVWENADDLALSFTETEIRWGGAPVLAEPNKSADSLPWTFFKDGIREITLSRGFEDVELTRMLDILQRARKAGAEDDDLLTMIWEADFTCLRYRYVDVGTESQTPLDAAPADTEPPPPGIVRATATTAAAKPAVVNMQDFDATLYFLDQSELNYLRGEIEREYSGNLRINVVGALLDIWEAQASPDIREEVAGILESMLLLMLAAGDLRGVTFVLEEAIDAVDRAAAVTQAQADRLGRIINQLSAPEPLGQLLQALDESADRPPMDHVADLFGQLQPAALGTALAWIPKIRSPEVKTMVEAAADRLASAHTDELVKLIIGDDGAVAMEAVRRSAALKLASAVGPMARLLAGGSASARMTVVQALTSIGSPAALQALEKAIDDSDREIRLATVRALLAKKHRGAFTRLEHQVKDKSIREKDLTERMAYFEAYGALCGDGGIPFLDGLLNGKGLFGKREDPEMRACAAIALGRIGTKKAVDSLQRSADEKEIVVRNAVTKALKGGAA